DLRNISVDAHRIPVVLSIADHGETVHRVRYARRYFGGRFRRRGIMQSLHPVPEICSPSRTLVREDVRLIEMKVIDHVGIPQRLEKNHFIIIRPASPRGYDGVLGSTLANGRRQSGLHPVPPIAVRELRLVYDFKE